MQAVEARPRPATTQHWQGHCPAHTLRHRCLRLHRQVCWCRDAVLGRRSRAKQQQMQR